MTLTYFKQIFFPILIFLFAIGSFGFYKIFLAGSPSPAPVILGQNIDPSPSPSPSPSPLPTPSPISEASPTPTPTPKPAKNKYIIALFGDSMIDTMGENSEYLQKSLNKRYPEVRFNLYNYGIGGQNVSLGLARFDKPFSNRDRNYPPISELNADIIIIGSFAYNPFSPHNRDKHWLTLTKLVDEAKKTGVGVYLLAEIAPLKIGFGRGPNGINWPENLAREQARHIVEQLENTVALAETLEVPLIDAFSQSQVDGKFGNPNYVDSHDGIHPSKLGHMFMADLIAETLKL